jgi:hypothetical protein
MRTWLVIGLIASLIVNAFLIGIMVGKPPMTAPFSREPFPPLPSVLKGRHAQEFRNSFFESNRPLHEHLMDLRRQLVAELASDSTNQARVDSLVNAISENQRELQLGIINYIDSLKSFAPMKDQLQLQRWILQNFDERQHMRHHRRSERDTERLPIPEGQPQ